MRARLRCALPSLGVALLFLPLTTTAGADPIVIANESVPVDTVEATNLERVFLGKSARVDGQRVGIVVLSGGPTHAGFLTDYLRKSPKQFLSHWRKLCFTGKGTMPSTCRTEEELVAHVAGTPGAIGYIEASTPHDGVKVLAIRP